MVDPTPTGRPGPPVDAAAALAWMGEHGDLLRTLVFEETADEDAGPASDGAIRANLRFVAAALAGTGSPQIAEPLDGFEADLPLQFVLGQDLIARHVEAGAGAIALEEHLQHGASPGDDPTLDAVLDRRIRIQGWMQLFLAELEQRLGPAGDGLSAAVTAELEGRQRHLVALILSLEVGTREALQREMARAPGADLVSDAQQAAVVQAYARVLLEAIADVLAAGAGDDDGAPAG